MIQARKKEQNKILIKRMRSRRKKSLEKRRKRIRKNCTYCERNVVCFHFRLCLPQHSQRVHTQFPFLTLNLIIGQSSHTTRGRQFPANGNRKKKPIYCYCNKNNNCWYSIVDNVSILTMRGSYALF